MYYLRYLEIVIDEVSKQVSSETHSKIFEHSPLSAVAIVIKIKFHQLGATVLLANLVPTVYPQLFEIRL